jgi:hypothetical protein
MKSSLKDREFDKFRPAPNDKSSISVTADTPIPVDSSGVYWDEITTTFPSSTQELFTYKKDAVIVQTVLVTYQATDKKTIISMVRERF